MIVGEHHDLDEGVHSESPIGPIARGFDRLGMYLCIKPHPGPISLPWRRRLSTTPHARIYVPSNVCWQVSRTVGSFGE